MISAATRVVVVPEYREQSNAAAEPAPTLPPTQPDEAPTSIKSIVRSIGAFVYSSLPKAPLGIFHEPEKKPNQENAQCKLALVPGRHRRAFRVELGDTPLTTARLNRSDWSAEGDDDGTRWPSLFVARITVYRSSKEVRSTSTDTSPSSIPEHLPKVVFLFVQLTHDDLCRRNHIKLNPSFARANGIRPTDKLVVCNTTRRPRTQCRIELISNQWCGPSLLLQHYFQVWLRQCSNNDQSVLITDGSSIQLDDVNYVVQLTSADAPVVNSDGPMYIAVNEDTIGQHSFAVEEKKEWNMSELETFRSMPIVDPFFSQQNQFPYEASIRCRALASYVDRLLPILELQLRIDRTKSSLMDDLLKNVLITGRSGSGKKTIIGECCQRLWSQHLIYYKFVDCLGFKGV